MALNLFKTYLKTIEKELCFFDPNYDGSIESNLKKSIDDLIDNYSNKGLKKADALDFNCLNLRCAYLYLYATSHTHMVLGALSRYQKYGSKDLWTLIQSAKNNQNVFNITSLGGGPGSDALGVMVFLNNFEILKHCPPVALSVVDRYQGWKSQFHSLMSSFSSNAVYREQYLIQDLLQPLSSEVEITLQNTHFLSMVKFVSAISGNSDGTNQILKQVFNLLPFGALVLIIDNAGGPAFQGALNVAFENGMDAVFGPECYVKFQVCKSLEPDMNKIARFEKKAQRSSTISMIILRKTAAYQFCSDGQFIRPAPALLQSPGVVKNNRYKIALRMREFHSDTTKVRNSQLNNRRRSTVKVKRLGKKIIKHMDLNKRPVNNLQTPLLQTPLLQTPLLQTPLLQTPLICDTNVNNAGNWEEPKFGDNSIFFGNAGEVNRWKKPNYAANSVGVGIPEPWNNGRLDNFQYRSDKFGYANDYENSNSRFAGPLANNGFHPATTGYHNKAYNNNCNNLSNAGYTSSDLMNPRFMNYNENGYFHQDSGTGFRYTRFQENFRPRNVCRNPFRLF